MEGRLAWFYRVSAKSLPTVYYTGLFVPTLHRLHCCNYRVRGCILLVAKYSSLQSILLDFANIVTLR